MVSPGLVIAGLMVSFLLVDPNLGKGHTWEVVSLMNIEESRKVLGIRPGASIDEIKQTYRDLVKVWHPDHFSQDPRLQSKAVERMKELNLAYQMLIKMSHPVPRRVEPQGGDRERERQQQEEERAEWVRQELERQRLYREERARMRCEEAERLKDVERKLRGRDAAEKAKHDRLRRTKILVNTVAILAILAIGLRYAVNASESRRFVELTKLAEQGDAVAQYDLGILYYKGQGTRQDYAEAVKWWLKSAERGYANAQFNLGTAYLHGQGVEQDYVRAYIWFTAAATRGDEEAFKARDDLVKVMTPAQTATAKAKIGRWGRK